MHSAIQVVPPLSRDYHETLERDLRDAGQVIDADVAIEIYQLMKDGKRLAPVRLSGILRERNGTFTSQKIVSTIRGMVARGSLVVSRRCRLQFSKILLSDAV